MTTPAAGKPRLKLKRPQELEQSVLMMCMSWAKWPQVRAVSRLIRVKNDAPFDGRRKIYLKPSKILHEDGISDIGGGWRSTPVAVELKRPDGGVLSLEQKQYLADATALGWITGVARSLDEFVAIFRAWDLAHGIRWRGDYTP